jgi:hypothetical protein
MKPRIYGIRNCDTMKKAFAWLDARKVDYEFHDYKKDGVPAAKLKEWAQRTGWEKLANTRGPTWRKIPESREIGAERGARPRPAAGKRERDQAADRRGGRRIAGRLRPGAIRCHVLTACVRATRRASSCCARESRGRRC